MKQRITQLINSLKQVTMKQYLFAFFSLLALILFIILISKINGTIEKNNQVYQNNKILKELIIKKDSIIAFTKLQNDTLYQTALIFASDRKEILAIVKEDSKIYKTLKDEKEKIPNIIRALPLTDLQRKVASYNY